MSSPKEERGSGQHSIFFSSRVHSSSPRFFGTVRAISKTSAFSRNELKWFSSGLEQD